jgi:5'-deoxynucleotidase YfbR-like HD superfamily hydrolase
MSIEFPKQSKKLEQLGDNHIFDAKRLIRHFLTFHNPTEKVMRYANKDKTTQEVGELKQSLAEHVNVMRELWDYIKKHDKKLIAVDDEIIMNMISKHDTHEVFTSDKVFKTQTDIENEHIADLEIARLHKIGGDEKTGEVIEQYKARLSNEAKIVKALDRLEPYLLMMYADRPDVHTKKDAYEIAKSIRDISPLLYKTSLFALRFLEMSKSKIGQKEFEFMN